MIWCPLLYGYVCGPLRFQPGRPCRRTFLLPEKSGDDPSP